MKKIVSLLLAAALAVSLAGCGGSATPSSASTGSPEASDAEPGAAVDTGAKEAPALAEQVAAGTLPALGERLPVAADIMVESDVLSLGQYGGTMTNWSNDNGRWGWGPYAEQGMFRFLQDGSGRVEANVCKEYSSNEDATVWTIKLREGMKWSDGQPFTADDVLFYYDHMSTPALNEDRTTVDSEAEGFYSPYTSKSYMCYQVEKDDSRYWATFDKVDDYTFTVTFAAPKPSFPVDVAVDNKWMFLPKHFYINYVARKDGVEDDATFPLITEEEALANGNRDFGKSWESYGTMSKDIGYYHWDYAIVPQVRSFIAVKDNWNRVGETYVLVRNPYFWKTDSEGRQLPYLDSLQFKIINEQDQVTLQAMSGEFDIYDPWVNFSTVATALQDTHELKAWNPPDWTARYETLQLNQTVKDLDKRALYQDIRFREALSICVDRDLLNETLRNGISAPWQASPVDYDDEWSAKWTALEVDRANQILDEITEPWDKAPGTFRKMKGTAKDVEIILSQKEASEGGDFVSLLQSAYAAVGVKLSQKIDADFRVTLLSNDVEASIECTNLSTPAIRPDSIVPMRNVAVWHSAYGKWYEDGKTEANGGIEPTGDVLELVKAYDAMKAASGPDRDAVVAENVKKIYDLHKKNIWIIGYLKPIPARNLVNKQLRNFPEGLMSVDEFRYYGLSRPEQWWRADAQ